MSLHLSDGWHRVPGDDGLLGSARAWTGNGDSKSYLWALIIDGSPEFLAGNVIPDYICDIIPDGDYRRILKLFDRDSEKSIEKIFRIYHGFEQQCKWDGKPANVSEYHPQLSAGAYQFYKKDFDAEQSFVEEAILKMRPAVQRTMRAWPSCGAGQVQLRGRVERATKKVIGIWRCSCDR